MKGLFFTVLMLFALSFSANAQAPNVQIEQNSMTIQDGKADLQLYDVSVKSGLRLMANKIPSRSNSTFVWLGKEYSVEYTSNKSYLLKGNGSEIELANKSELKKHLLSIQ